MDVDTLHLFAQVMNLRSFTEVAKQRGIAASSVSRSISALESEVGALLFQRTTRQIAPTEAGLLYFERINAILEELEIAKQLAVDTKNQPKGRLRISLPKVFGELHIIPLLAEFTERYPELNLEILLNDRFVDLVEERIDLAIRLGSLEDSTYIARKLSPMSFYITASPDYLAQFGIPNLPEEIKQHNCLLFPRSGHNFNWSFRSGGKTQEITVNGKHLLTQSSAIKQCTIDGMGLSLLPDWLVKAEVENGQLVRILCDFEVTATDYNGAIWMVYPSREYLPVKVSTFCNFLLERLAIASSH